MSQWKKIEWKLEYVYKWVSMKIIHFNTHFNTVYAILRGNLWSLHAYSRTEKD